MSTIKSSDEHLTLNADGSSKDIKFQANGVEKASISSSGAFTSTTIDATKLTGDLPAISGANLTGVGVAGISSSADATAMTITSAEKIGIGETAPLGQLHIKEQDSGVSSISANGDQLVLENSGHCGMHILSGTSSDGILYFGDSGGSGMGQLKYQHGSNQFVFETNQSGALTITSDGRGLSQFTARGWVHFSGAGTLSIADSHNVSSVTDSSNGHYEINWSNNMANTNYAVACTSGHQETGGQTDSYTATSFRHQGILTNKVEIQCVRLKFNEQQMADPYIVCLVAFGD
nr:hypothetical protein [uncultured Mediterranean phage uvMED]